MTEEILGLCSLLEENIADEALARQGYLDILRYYGNWLLKQEVNEIEEIIAEELKHSELLAAMIKRRTLIKAEK